MCKECGSASESFFHMFWECFKARNTWVSLSLFTSPLLIPFWTFFEFLWHVLMNAQRVMEDAGLTLTIAWALWTNKNEVIHSKLRKTGLLLVDWCRSYLEEYWATSNTLLTQLTPQTQVEVKCSPLIFFIIQDKCGCCYILDSKGCCTKHH